MDFVLPDGNSIRLLAPFADMLNHSSEIKQCHVYDASSKSLSILAGKDYEAGDQVWLSCCLLVLICAHRGNILLGFHLLRTCSKQSPPTSIWLCLTR